MASKKVSLARDALERVKKAKKDSPSTMTGGKRTDDNDWAMHGAAAGSRQSVLDIVNPTRRSALLSAAKTGTKEKTADDLYKEVIKSAFEYGNTSPEARLELASSLANGSITAPTKGNLNDWSDATTWRTIIDNVRYADELSSLFNDPTFAFNKDYAYLPETSYMKGLLAETQKKYDESVKLDAQMKTDREQTARDATQWQNIYKAVQDEKDEADEWYNLLLIDWMLGDRQQQFDFEALDTLYDYDHMDNATYESEMARLKKQRDELDWEHLTGSKSGRYESETEVLEAQLNHLNKVLEDRTTSEELAALARSNPEFAAQSEYKGDKWTYGVNDDLLYQSPYYYINNVGDNVSDFYQATHQNKMNWATQQLEAYTSPYADKGYEYMTKDEIAIYNTLFHTDQVKAAEYLEAMSGELYARRAMSNESFWSTMASHPGTGLLAYALARGADQFNVEDRLMQTAAALTGNDDPNAKWYDQANMKGYVDETNVKNLGDIEWLNGIQIDGKNLAQHAYSAGSGLLDSAIPMAVDWFFGGSGLLNKATMAGRAYSSGLQEGAERDLSAGQTMLTGGANAFMGWLSEKIGMDPGKLGSGSSNLRNFISEGAEELMEALGTDAADEVISRIYGTQSNFEADVEELRLAGDKDAVKHALENKLAEYATDAIYGGIAGFGMGLPGNIANSIDNRQTGRSIQQHGDAEKILEIAKSMPEGSEARRIALDIEEHVGKGKAMSLGNLGKMTKSLTGELSEEYNDITTGVMDQAIEQRLVELGTDPNAAKSNAVAIRKMVYGEKLTIKERAAVAWDENADKVTKEVFGRATEETAQPQQNQEEKTEVPEGIQNHDIGQSAERFVDTRELDKPSARKMQIADIEGRLQGMEVDSEEAKQLAPIIQKEFRGEKLTKGERAYLEGNEKAEQVINELNFEQREQQKKTNEGNAEALLEIAAGMPAGSLSESVAKNIQNRIEARDRKSMTFHEIAELASSMVTEVTGKNSATIKRMLDQAIEYRLIEYGESKSDAKKVSRTIRRLFLGEDVSVADRLELNAIGKSKGDILNELQTETEFRAKETPRKKETFTPQWVHDMRARQYEAAGEVESKMRQVQAAAKTKNVSQTVKDAAARGADKVQKGKNGAPLGKDTDRNISYGDGEKTGSGRLARFEEVDGKLTMAVETGKGEDGKNVTVNVPLESLNTAHGKGTAGIIEAVHDINETLHPVSAEEASTLLATYEITGGDVGTFVENYERAYLAGYSGMETKQVALDPKLAQMAMDSGKRQAEADEQQRKRRASAYKAVANPTSGWLGKVSSNAEVRGSGDAKALPEALKSMTESQRVTAEAAIEFGKAVGLNVVLFESDAGHIGSIQNGSFDASTHTVYLDVNSGAVSAQDIQAQKESGTLGYAIMRTLGHEATHYLEAASPEMYGKYKAAVRDALKAKGEDMTVLIRQKLDNAYAKGHKLSYEGAVAEVVADASEYMLQDSKFTNDLDPTLKGRIKTFIQNFMGKVKEILNNLTGAHRESKALREMVDGVYHYTGNLQELWDASLQEVLGKGTEDLTGDATGTVEEQATEDVPFSMRDEDLTYASATDEDFHRNGRIYDYDFLVEQKPISVITIPSVNTLMSNGRFSRIDVVEAGKAGIPGAANEQGHKKVTNVYTDRSLTITNNSIRHGLNGDKPRLLANAQIGMVIGDVVENGIPVNGLAPTDGNALQTYAMVTPCITEDGKRMMAVTHVDIQKNEVNSVTFTDIVHSANGRIYKNSEPVSNTIDVEGKGPYHPSRYTISISDLLRDVNISFKSLLSQDVLEHLGEERPANGAYSAKVLYSERDLPSDITVRDYLAELKPTDRMNETEKILLKRYQDTLGKLREAEKNAAEQDEIIKTATGDELTKAKNRWQIYRNQANRYARELARAERNEGFAGLMATGQKLVNQYLTGGYNRIADAQDELEMEIRSLGEQLKAIGKTVEGAEQGQKTAHARGLFNQGELNAAAKQLKDSYGSRMSIKEISNRLALAYGEIYANNGAEGAKRFADAAKALAQDITNSSKYRYRSETLTMIAEEIPTISLTETDKQEIKNAGLTITEYKRGLSPYVKVVEGASDLSSYVSNAEAYGGQIANILGTDTEGDLAMALYNVIQTEKQAEGVGTFEGMTEGESLSAVMVDIMSANLPMTTNSNTLNYLRKEMLKYAGENQAAAAAVDKAIQNVKTATKKASSLWLRAVQEVELSEHAIDYYRALEEQRRLMELQDQKKELTEQLKTDAAKKIHEQVEKQRTEYREREQRAREYRKTRDEVDKLRRGIGRKVKRLNTLRVRETDQKHVPQELQHVADLVMQTFTDTNLGRLAFSQEKLNSLSRRYRLMMEMENDYASRWDDEIETIIENLQALGEAYNALKNREAGVPSYYSLEGVELETEILQGVDAIVSNVLQMIDSANDSFLTQRNDTFNEFANKTGEKLQAHDDHKVRKGWRGKWQVWLDETIRTGNMTPIYFFEHLQNQELLDVFNELRRGQALYAQIVAEGKDYVKAAKEKHNYGAWVNDGKLKFETSQKDPKTKKGHVIELTREEAAEIYAIAKREQANKLYQTEHLLYGGFQYKNIQDKVSEDGKTQQTDKPHQLAKADIARIGEWLTAEQKAYADDLVGFLSTTMADYGNAASMDMYGYKKFTESYYIPFHTVADQRFQMGDEGPQGENAGTGRVKNSGFTKKLQHKANQPLLVGGLTDTVADHIHKMAAYSAMVQPIENMKRLLNHKVLEPDGTSNTIRALIGQKYGKASQDYLTQLLKDANGATMSDQRAAALTDKLVGAFKRGAVMASASVVLQQPTAAARAMAYISPKYFAQNPFYRPSKGTWDEVMKYSGTAVIKDMGKFDVGMGLTASQYIADENLGVFEAYQRLKADSKTKAGKAAYDRFMAWLTSAPGAADQWTWGLIWKANKAKQAELHPEMDHSSEAFLELCGETFDDVIDHTQVYDSVLTRSNLMRSTNALHKMATSFMSEPTLSLNMIYDALTGKHGKKQGARIIGSVVASQVLAGALAALAQAWNDDDDERNWMEKYADRATGNILDNLNPLGMIPYISDIVSLFEGYDVERPDMSVIADIYDYSKTFFKAFEDGGTPSWKQIENFAGTFANLVGIPAKNISREIRRTRNAIVNTEWSAPDAFGVGQAVLGNIPGYGVSKKDYYQRIVTALVRGETEQAEDYKNYMLASKAVDADALTKGLRDAYKEEYEQGGIDKDTAIDFLLENNLVTGDTEDKRKQSAFQYVDKWEEGTDGYSAYNTLKAAYGAISFGDIQKAWKELTNNGYSDEQVKTQSRTLLKELVKDGTITPNQATQLLRKWCSYKKDSDNVDKPKEWLKNK